MSEHTKKPWELVFEPGHDAGTITIRAKDRLAIAEEPLFADYRGAIIAQCTAILGRDDSASRVLANARLIAAAPDLLAALEEMLAAAPQHHDTTEGHRLYLANQQARAAIEKAKP